MFTGETGHRLGLRSGDVIRCYSGEEITSTSQFLDLSFARGGSNSLIAIRDTEALRLTVPAGPLGLKVEPQF